MSNPLERARALHRTVAPRLARLSHAVVRPFQRTPTAFLPPGQRTDAPRTAAAFTGTVRTGCPHIAAPDGIRATGSTQECCPGCSAASGDRRRTDTTR